MRLRSLLQRFPRFTLLTGAGISIDAPACLPRAEPIMCAVLDALKLPKSHRLRSTLPSVVRDNHHLLRFETLVSILRDFGDPNLTVLAPLAQATEPNRLHRLCAQFFRLGWHHVTCNFDCLIERAADELRIPLPNVLVYENDYRRWRGGAALCKIHGSFLDIKGRDASRTIRATLDSIGTGGEGFVFEPEKHRHLKQALCDHPILALGYSASDDFDINKFIRRNRSPYDIVWIWHDQTTPRVYDKIDTARIPARLKATLREIEESSARKVWVVVGLTTSVLQTLSAMHGCRTFVGSRTDKCTNDLSQDISNLIAALRLSPTTRHTIPAELLWQTHHYVTATGAFTTIMKGGPSTNQDTLDMQIRSCLRCAEYIGNEGHYAESARLYRKAVLWNAGKNKAYLGEAEHSLGNIAHDQGRYDQAKKHYTAAQGAFRMAGREKDLARSVFQVGRVFHQQGFVERAVSLWRSTETAMRTDQRNLAILYNLLGLAHWQLRDPQAAHDFFQRSLEIREQFDERGVVATLSLRALMGTDDRAFYPTALADIQRALRVYKRFRDTYGLAGARYTAGRLYESAGDSTKARSLYREALADARAVKNPKGLAVCYQGLARTAQTRKDAGLYHRHAVRSFRRLGCQRRRIPRTPASLERLLETIF